MAMGVGARMTTGNESLCLASCSKEELFGAEGLCVESDGTCVCPSGFDGLDLLSFSEDCHVSTAIRVFILSSVLILSLTATAVAIVGMVVTSKNKGGVFMVWRSWLSLSSRVCKRLRPAQEHSLDGEEPGLETTLRRFSRLSISQSLSSSANRPPPPVKRDRNGFPLPSTTVNSTTSVLQTSVLPSVPASELYVTVDEPMPLTYRRQSKLIKEATMRQFGLMVLFALYGVTQTVFAVSGLFLNEFRHDENNLEFIAFALSITLIMGSIWQIPNILSRGLPSLKVYGSLFGINDLISRYTDVVKWTNQVLATFSATTTFVLSYVLPLLMGPGNRRLYDKVLFISCGVLTLAWLLHTMAVSMLLLNVYAKGLEAMKSRLGELPTNILALTRGLARARSLIRFNLLSSVVFAVAVSSLMFALALSDLVYRNSYVFLGLGFSISCLIAIGYSILLLIFTRVVW